MSSATEQWSLDRLGQWSEPRAFAVTEERVVAYAKATNDTHAGHLSGELAPPVFAIVPVFEVMAPQIVGVLPGELAMRVVHGEQHFDFHKPIVPGQQLVSRAAAVGVHGRSTGVVVVGKAETTTEDGDPVVTQYMTCFVRGAQYDVDDGENVPDHAFPDALRGTAPSAEVTQAYDADQTVRYSEASGDPMPIHLDDDFAKAMGLPGIIVHGLCTMAFASRVVVDAACPDDPSRLKRLAVKFSKIVQPSDTITTRLHEAADGTLHFETESSAGGYALKDGLARVAA